MNQFASFDRIGCFFRKGQGRKVHRCMLKWIHLYLYLNLSNFVTFQAFALGNQSFFENISRRYPLFFVVGIGSETFRLICLLWQQDLELSLGQQKSDSLSDSRLDLDYFNHFKTK